jgi:hypothetical protein
MDADSWGNLSDLETENLSDLDISTKPHTPPPPKPKRKYTRKPKGDTPMMKGDQPVRKKKKAIPAPPPMDEDV